MKSKIFGMLKLRSFSIFAVIGLLVVSACSTQEKAQIVFGGGNRDKVSGDYSTSSPYQAPNASFNRYKIHEVLFTDTVASLATRYNVSPHDIITLNNLTKPYDLEPGEVVKIPIYENSANPQDGFLRLPAGHQPQSLAPAKAGSLEQNKNTVKILPSLPSEQLQDYDY